MAQVILAGALSLVAQITYFLTTGALAAYFNPRFLLFGASFIGLFFGPRVGILWGFGFGLLEELVGLNQSASFGWNALGYLWCGYLSGRYLHDRLDTTSPLIGMLLAFLSIALMFFLDGIAIFIFHGAQFSLYYHWKSLVSAFFEVSIFGPLLYLVYYYFLKPKRSYG